MANLGDNRPHAVKISAGAQAQSEAELSHAESKSSEAQKAFSLCQNLWNEKVKKLDHFRQRFPTLDRPEDVKSVEQFKIQKDGLWQDSELNKLRSELFAAALQLHEAWLAEVSRPGVGFRANIFAVSELLSNKRPEDDADLLPIWQSLFLMVPVVSSTFASFANQFRGRDQELPSLYIISPFRAVAKALKSNLGPDEWQPKIGNAKPPKRTDLRKWLKERIGTVHTFQGKEEDTVIMVLGVDEQTQGAAGWASSKPNLLNVALTRAKRRFFIVGDQAVWGQMNYFDQAKRELELRSGEQILATIRASPSTTK